MKTKFLRSLLCVVLAMGMIFSIGCGGKESEEEKISGTYFNEYYKLTFTSSDSKENSGMMETGIYDEKSSQSFEVRNNIIYTVSLGEEITCGIVQSKNKIAIRKYNVNYNITRWKDSYEGTFPAGNNFNTIIQEDSTGTWCNTYDFSEDGTVKNYLINKSGEKSYIINGSYEREGNVITLNFPSNPIKNCSFMIIGGIIYPCLVCEKI